MLCCTQPQSRAQTCLPFRPGPGPSAHGRQVLPRMASTAIVDAIGGENSACHNFRGMYFLIPPFGNGLLEMWNIIFFFSYILGRGN
jgi:hypothetical protein